MGKCPAFAKRVFGYARLQIRVTKRAFDGVAHIAWRCPHFRRGLPFFTRGDRGDYIIIGCSVRQSRVHIRWMHPVDNKFRSRTATAGDAGCCAPIDVIVRNSAGLVPHQSHFFAAGNGSNRRRNLSAGGSRCLCVNGAIYAGFTATHIAGANVHQHGVDEGARQSGIAGYGYVRQRSELI